MKNEIPHFIFLECLLLIILTFPYTGHHPFIRGKLQTAKVNAPQ